MSWDDDIGDVAIISFHEKGFWQADLYLKAEHWDRQEWDNGGHEPDAFFTMPSDPDINRSDVMRRAAEKWPRALIREAAEDDEDEDWDD